MSVRLECPGHAEAVGILFEVRLQGHSAKGRGLGNGILESVHVAEVHRHIFGHLVGEADGGVRLDDLLR